MKVRDFASQFTIHVFAADIDRGAGLKVVLSQAGYDAYFFENQDTLISRLQQRPPHLLVFQTSTLKGNLSDFVEQVLKINSEIRMVFVAKVEQFQTLSAYDEYGLMDLIEDQPVGFNPRALFAVDRACEKLYLQYQNEHLIDEVRKWKDLSQNQASQSETKDHELARKSPPVEARIKDYLSAESKEDLLRRFILGLERIPSVYLKFLPTVKSLAVTLATVFDQDRLQGVTNQLSPEEGKDFETQVSLGFVPPTLTKTLKDAFGFAESVLLPLFVHGELEGLVAFPKSISPEEKLRLHDEFSLMSMAYSNMSLEKRVDALEVQDPITEVFNRKFYRNRLQEEWARARRAKQPLSILKLALDDFYELEQTLGEATRDALLKNLAQIANKTSRTNDVTCRTGLNEFSLILPNAPRQGAMIRAERLRRIVESSQILDNGLKISISIGISEYPTLCSSADSLDETAGKALAHILDKGGNRLCLFKAPADHQPEFPVAAEPGA